MKRFLFNGRQRSFISKRLILIGGLCVVAVGCGGSGGSNGGGGGGGNANPYAGSYSGTFVDQNDFIGTGAMTISSTGVVQGTFAYTPPVAFNGQISNTGTGSITDSNGTFQMGLGKSGLPTLGVGIGTKTNGAFMTLISNPNDTFSGFSGDYAGTVDNTTLNATGVIALSISSGTVSGVDVFGVNGVPTLEGVSGTLTNAGLLSYTVNGITVTGSVTLAGGIISGSMQESDGDSANLSVSQVTH